MSLNLLSIERQFLGKEAPLEYTFSTVWILECDVVLERRVLGR